MTQKILITVRHHLQNCRLQSAIEVAIFPYIEMNAIYSNLAKASNYNAFIPYDSKFPLQSAGSIPKFLPNWGPNVLPNYKSITENKALKSSLKRPSVRLLLIDSFFVTTGKQNNNKLLSQKRSFITPWRTMVSNRPSYAI